jgi:hypothetical protein
VEASSQLHALTAFRLGKRSRFSLGYDAKMMLDEPRLQCGLFVEKKISVPFGNEAKFFDIPA